MVAVTVLLTAYLVVPFILGMVHAESDPYIRPRLEYKTKGHYLFLTYPLGRAFRSWISEEAK